MAHNSDDFVATIAILVIFGGPLAYMIANRVFAHHERLEMIKRGVVPPPDPRWAQRMARQMRYGAPAAGSSMSYDPYAYAQYQADRSLRKGVTVGMVGLALLVGLSFIHPGHPGPWLLGGLIPLFVGIAQIIVALMSGARFGPSGPALGGPPPPPGGQRPADYQEAPPFTTSDIPPGPSGWRPGSTTELQRPARPPDAK